MDIALESLSATSFTLELPPGQRSGARRLKLSEVMSLGGALHTEPGLVRLQDATVDSGQVDAINWPFGRAFLTGGPAALGRVQVTADFPSGKPISGNATIGELATTSLKLGTPSVQVTSDIRVREAQLAATNDEADNTDGEGTGELGARFESVAVENLQLQLGELLLRGAATARDLRIVSGSGPLTIASSGAEALGLTLVHPRAEITTAGIEAPQGLAFKGGELRIDELHVGAMKVLLPLEPKEATTEDAADPPAPSAKIELRDDVVCLGERHRGDRRDLDHVDGKAEIAVFVKAQLPVVGSYKLDRTFKVPVNDGHIDFVEVERQLGTIEDAFIDFAVRKNELIIKRDIPLLPTKGKKLVRWPLSAVEQAHAETSRSASLRTLTRFELATAKDGDSKASIAEVRIDIPTLSLALATGEDTSKDTSDAEFQIRSFDPLSMTGGLRFGGKDEARELDAQTTVRGLELQVVGFPVGESLFGIRSMRCGELRVSVAKWDGFRPLAIEIELGDVALEGLTLRRAT